MLQSPVNPQAQVMNMKAQTKKRHSKTTVFLTFLVSAQLLIGVGFLIIPGKEQTALDTLHQSPRPSGQIKRGPETK